MTILTARACDECGSSYWPLAEKQRFCSNPCRERSKYRDRRADPAQWEPYLTRRREKYTPKPKPAPRQCSVVSCDAKHFALGLCRKHYRRRRWTQGRDGRDVAAGRRIPVGALAKHYDAEGNFTEEPYAVRVYVEVSGVIFPHCPECGRIMFKIPETDPMDLRDCGSCRLRVNLNAEEVSWVISERRSTAP
jgi:hypothetical protein